MSNKLPIQVTFEPTPNPATMKFKISNRISEQNLEFLNAQDAERSPLANKIFGFPWTNSIFIGGDFVTVTKQDWVEWNVLAEPLAGLIQEHLDRGELVLLPLPSEASEMNNPSESENDTPIVKNIKRVLDNEIRPMVALDGGDIRFARYENQILYIKMQGACSGCPSSAMTLKEGIETRIRELFPEVQEVVSV